MFFLKQVIFKVPVFRFKGDVHLARVFGPVAGQRHDSRGACCRRPASGSSLCACPPALNVSPRSFADHVGAQDFACDDRPEELTGEEERTEKEEGRLTSQRPPLCLRGFYSTVVWSIKAHVSQVSSSLQR